MDSIENANVTLEVSVKVRKGDELLEVISASSKLTKADAGVSSPDSDDQIYISISPGADGNYEASSISVNFHGKLTKDDAGLLKL